MDSICVFCGSSTGLPERYTADARELGRQLAVRGKRLVYGAGSIGLMGVVADACLEQQGEVVGIIPQFLARKEVLHAGVTHLRLVPNMHARKALMAELADAFVALPGGLGTMEELFEVLTWSQLGLHVKPIVLLNTAGFFDPLIAMVEHLVSEEFCSPEHGRLFRVAGSVDELFVQLRDWSRPNIPNWAQLAR